MRLPNTDNTVIHPVSEKIDLLALHTHHPSRYPFLLQTMASSVGQSQFDILFACPQQSLFLDKDFNLSFKHADSHILAFENNQDFLSCFDQHWQNESGNFDANLPLPFQGGWFVFLGYELAQQIEPSLRLPNSDQSGLPVACATRIPAAIIVNKITSECSIIAEASFHDCIDKIRADIINSGNNINPEISHNSDVVGTTIRSITEDPSNLYLDSVSRIKRYVRDGDVFQVNLSRLWTAELIDGVSNTRLYQRLSRSNPAPFFALASFGENAILSSSPERLIRVKGSNVETRPIAGTRPRGDTPQQDLHELQELQEHPKERAEHIMLIDLERNDLGRVCKPGTVNVNELMTLETYAHVHHIVSNIQGELIQNTTPGNIIRAVFPGGTITGCPKVRCMEIIAELEQQPRGAYTGSLGYVNHDGSMDLNILIRTVVRNQQQLSFRAGAGIVADSDPDQELQETRAKAKGLLLAM